MLCPFSLEVTRKFPAPNDRKGQPSASLRGLVKSPCIRSSAVLGNGGSMPETPGCYHLLHQERKELWFSVRAAGLHH